MSATKFKIVEIIWLDSDHNAEWEKLEDVLADQGGLECRTCGYLVADKEDRVIVATSMTADPEREEHISYYIAIPKIAIVSMKELRKK
jgi:hypothetical protein